MSYYEQNYNTHEPYNPGSQPVYMTDPAQGHNFQGDSQAVARWLTGQNPNAHFPYPGAEHSVARVNSPSIGRDIGDLQRQYAHHARAWSQDTTSSAQSGFVPSPLPQPSMASPPSPPLAPWSPSAPQYFGKNPNAFAPPRLPSPPPQAQAQGWVPQPHPQPAGGLGPSVVENNSLNNHVQDVGMQYGYAPQQIYAYPQPTENISAWEYAYIPEVVQLNYAGQTQPSLPMGSQQVYAGLESTNSHQHGTSSIAAQTFHGAVHHASAPHMQHTPHVIRGGAQSQSSSLHQNYGHHCRSGCPEQAPLSNVDDQMDSYSFPAATMVTNQVPESEHQDGSAKKTPKRTAKPKRQTKSRSKKATTPANQGTATATEIAPPETAPVCPPGTVDPKDVFSNPDAGRVARPRAAVVKRRQARAGVQAADRVPANSQATDEDNSNPALGDENLAPDSNSLDARAQALNKLKLARLQEPVPLTYLPEVTGGEALCFLCSYPIKTGWKTDARSGKGHYRGDGFKWHQFNKERRFRCRPLVHLGVKELPDKSITNIDNLAVWLLIMHPKLAVTEPKPFHYAQLGKDVTRQLRWWWNKKLKPPQRAQWIARARV